MRYYLEFGLFVFIRVTVYRSFGRLSERSLLAGMVFACLSLAATTSEPVLQTLIHTRPDAFMRELQLRRPIPVAGELKAKIIRSLPREGEVTRLNASQLRKLEALKPVLEVHDRLSVYTIKVIEVPEAVVALHERSVLLISEPGLALWNAAQLQALAAHEIGHEYTWGLYQDARAKSMARSSARVGTL
jgi:hypothetical protein